jgi:hypothetical protein
MIQLPTIEMQATDDVWLTKHYPCSGRYIVNRDNGDVSIVDVQLQQLPADAARDGKERATYLTEVFIGQPALLDPDDWTLKTDVENMRNAKQVEIDTLKKQMEAARTDHKAAMEDARQQMQHDFDLKAEQMKQEYQQRQTNLEHEYELRRQQLELETPKRFAQGEWVSGKTLTEIIKTLTGKGQEDAAR